MKTAQDDRHDPTSPTVVLGLLEGYWRGKGKGEFPTIDSFDYIETLLFERRDENSLFYNQRTEQRKNGQTEFVTSHWESGFFRILAINELELANVQSGGRGEVLIGTIAMLGRVIKIDFKSNSLSNDERMVATTRTFEIDGNTLRYEMMMRTNMVGKLARHLAATLQRAD